MNNAGAHGTADTGKLVATMRQQRVDQGAVLIPGRGMHHQPRRFVEHQQILVFKKDGERDLFRLDVQRSGRGDLHAHAFAGAHVMLRLRGLAFDQDMLLADKPLQMRAGELRQTRMHELIKPFVTLRSAGAGLGLYLVRKILVAHEGKLSLYRKDHGAGIKLFMPSARVKTYDNTAS